MFARKLRLWRKNSNPEMVMMVPVELLKQGKTVLALLIRQESTSLALVKVGLVNKQTIDCQREMADQPEVTDAAGEKSQSGLAIA